MRKALIRRRPSESGLSNDQVFGGSRCFTGTSIALVGRILKNIHAVAAIDRVACLGAAGTGPDFVVVALGLDGRVAIDLGGIPPEPGLPTDQRLARVADRDPDP